jgi:mannose-1-phosphate guanylyltransferase
MEIVVLAGGGGTRLWPLSDPARPKPFLPLLGEETLIQRTVARIGPLAPSSVTVVTDRRYEDLVRAQLPGVRILSEPFGRNTAAAVALAAHGGSGPADEVTIVLPADHDVRAETDFAEVLAAAAEHLATGPFGIDGPLVTLGIEPDRPATEYGYLRPMLDAGAVLGGLRAWPLASFEEKPGPDRAAELVGMPGVSWNAGIFLWQRRAIAQALDRYAPEIVAAIATAGGASATEPAGATTPSSALESAYRDLPSRSIDVAVMEPAAADGRVVMGAMQVGWSDIGSWDALLGRLGARATGRVIQAGDSARAEESDLVVTREAGLLRIAEGPRDILAADPVALLSGAASDRPIVEALIDRVSAAEGAR